MKYIKMVIIFLSGLILGLGVTLYYGGKYYQEYVESTFITNEALIIQNFSLFKSKSDKVDYCFRKGMASDSLKRLNNRLDDIDKSNLNVFLDMSVAFANEELIRYQESESIADRHVCH